MNHGYLATNYASPGVTGTKKERRQEQWGQYRQQSTYTFSAPYIHRPDNQQSKDHQWIPIPHTKTHTPAQCIPMHHESAQTHIRNRTRHTTRNWSSGGVFPAHLITEPGEQHSRVRRLKFEESAGTSMRRRMLRLSVITTLPRVQGAGLSGWRTRSKAGCGHEARDTQVPRLILWGVPSLPSLLIVIVIVEHSVRGPAL
jgi:hypothetical protein